MRPVPKSLKFTGISFLLGGLLIATLSARAVKPYKPQTQDAANSNLHWSPAKSEISSTNSRLDLELPNLASKSDWIVGVQPTQGDEKETISVGLVSWEDANQNPALAGKPVNFKLISSITDLPSSQIQTTDGKVIIPGLDNYTESSGSLLIILKVKPGTKVHIRHGGNVFVGDSPDTSFIVHNGVRSSKPMKGTHSLVGNLIRSKMLGTKGE